MVLYSQGEKEYLKEIINLKLNNHHLVLDTMNLRIQMHDINRKFNYNTNYQNWIIDSLRWQNKKLTKDNDSLRLFQKKVFEISENSAIIYQRDNNQDDIFYINLNSYSMKLKGDVIILIPIADESNWKKPRVYGYPQSDNLSLHLFPHKYEGDKIKKSKNGF